MPTRTEVTHVAHVDDRTLLAARGGEIGKGVGRHRGHSLEAGATTVATAHTTKATPETAAKAAATAEATTGTKATATEAAAEAAAATKAHAGAGKAVLANLQGPALPVVAIELLDGIACVVGGLKGHNSGALGATGGIGVDVGTDDGALLCWKAMGSISTRREGGRSRRETQVGTYLLGGRDLSNLASQH